MVKIFWWRGSLGIRILLGRLKIFEWGGGVQITGEGIDMFSEVVEIFREGGDYFRSVEFFHGIECFFGEEIRYF